MSDCVFCKILAGEIPGSFVYEDARAVAFMDIHQPNAYKVLVIPRQHAETIYDLDDEVASGVMLASVKIARAIRDVTQCEGLSVFQANGAAAGQEVWHFHFHLLPRYKGDKHWQGEGSQNEYPERAKLDEMAAALRDKLAELG